MGSVLWRVGGSEASGMTYSRPWGSVTGRRVLLTIVCCGGYLRDRPGARSYGYSSGPGRRSSPHYRSVKVTQ